MKVCAVCGEEKSCDLFYKHRAVCKVCYIQRTMERKPRPQSGDIVSCVRRRTMWHMRKFNLPNSLGCAWEDFVDYLQVRLLRPSEFYITYITKPLQGMPEEELVKLHHYTNFQAKRR